MGNGSRSNIFACYREVGFTLVGSMVSVAMMGGLALFLADLTRQQQSVQQTVETEVELGAMFNRMIRTLYDGDACNETLGVGSPIQDGRSLDYIRDEDGEIVFEVNEKYGNRLLQIESMTLTNSRIMNTAAGSFGEVELNIVVLKLSKGIKGYNKVGKSFPFSVDVVAGTGGNFNLVNCHYTGNQLAEIARDVATNDIVPMVDTKMSGTKEDFCNMAGGNFDTSAGTCSFSGTLPPPVGGGDSDDDSTSPDVPRHFDPPVSVPEDDFCNQPEYICLPASVGKKLSACGLKAGADAVNMGIYRYIASACYIPNAAHDFSIGTSGTSCEAAKQDARSRADPGNLAGTSSTVMPSGHFAGKIYCDSDCSHDGTTYAIRCRLFVRGLAWKCTYMCRNP